MSEGRRGAALRCTVSASAVGAGSGSLMRCFGSNAEQAVRNLLRKAAAKAGKNVLSVRSPNDP